MVPVLEMSIYRAPRAPRFSSRKVLGVEGRLAVAEALALLSGSQAGLQGEDALAERERLRLEAERAKQRQGELELGRAG